MKRFASYFYEIIKKYLIYLLLTVFLIIELTHFDGNLHTTYFRKINNTIEALQIIRLSAYT